MNAAPERSSRSQSETAVMPSGQGRFVAELRAVWGWGEPEEILLADLAERLEDHLEEFARVWTERLLALAQPALPHSQQLSDVITWVNYSFLEGHVRSLRQRNLEGMFQDNFDNDVRLLRSQRESDPELRSTLSQLYLSLEISTALVIEWAKKLYAGDARLPALLQAYGCVALQLGKIVGQAFHDVRSEELNDALRVASSLLETSRELSAGSASVGEVLSKLTVMVRRLLHCDRSLTFLWDATEEAYVPWEGLGFGHDEMVEIRKYRFHRGDHMVTEGLLAGQASSGSRNDGRVARDLMERHDVDAYALVPIIGSLGQPIGLLAAYRSQPDLFSATDVQILEGVAHNAGLAIENATLVGKLELANQLKSEFINSMSHEIRTPLHVLFGYLDMVGEQLSDEAGRDIVGRMRQNTGYLLKLVNTILDVGRIETGRMPLQIETFTIDEVLHELQQLFGKGGWGTGVDFSCEVSEGVPPLVNDRLKVLAILNNLVANAFKFTEHGRVSVRATSPDKEQVVLEVNDTGRGIAPEAIGVVFELFRQVGPSDRGGTGLGLYIVKRLTDMLGGEVSVRSRPGIGSTFRVAIPAVIREAESNVA